MSAFIGYLGERLPARIFGPALIGLTALAWWVAPPALAGDLARSAAGCLLLLLQFRLWDDLEDRDADRLTHPARVLAQTAVVPFRGALVVLALAALVVASPTPPGLVMLAVLDTAFVCAYRCLRRHLRDDAWRFGVLLLKYPAFVAIVAFIGDGAADGRRLVAAAAAAYVGAAAYERWHTRRMRASATPGVAHAGTRRPVSWSRP